MDVNYLDELRKLSKDEFLTFMKSGAFTGFTQENLAKAANDADRQAMEFFNECLRVMAEARRGL